MATRKKKKTFKLMQYQTIVEEKGATAGRRKNNIAVGRREYVCVDSGLTWEEAQDARREDQSLIIVLEARVYKKRAKKVKASEELG